VAERYALMWSGGKDSALALRRVRARGVNVTRLASGSRAVLTCVEITKLGEEWLGRVIDERFVAEVAATGIDPAGEHGEYHSFAYVGPLFKTPVRWRAGVRRSDGDFAQLDLELSPVGSRTPRSSARRLRRVRSTSS